MADFLSRRTLLLSSMDVTFIGFEPLKDLDEKDDEFCDIWVKRKQVSKRRLSTTRWVFVQRYHTLCTQMFTAANYH